ncbi:hypothetical protein WJX77_004293 [Trebouxia sp. C0004]
MQSTADTALGYMKALGNKAKQYALNLTDIEIKVEQATNNDPWGPHGTVMGEIAKASYDIDNYKQIMGVVARRLQDTEEDWRHVYKSLLLLEFMSKHGPQKVVEELVSNIGVVEKLQNFQYKDPKGKDWGLNVRNRAKELANFVLNPDRVRAERAKAKQNESKYTGVSSNDLGGGSGFGSKSSSSIGGGASALSKLPSSKSSKSYDSKSYDDDLAMPDRSGGNTKSGGGFADDAVQATKARIEALKKETSVPESPSQDSIPAKPPQARPRPSPAVADSKGPKKLSDVKVSANIAASLGNIKLASSAASPSSGSAARSSAGGASAMPAAATPMPASTTAAPSHMDLLGGLDAPAPTAAQQGSGSPGADVWSTFSTSRDAAPAAPDVFGADLFGAAPAPSAAGVDLFGAAPQATGRPSASPVAAFSASSDPFAMTGSDFGGSTFGTSTSHTGAASNGGTDPFGMSSLAATSSKGLTSAPPARPLPEDMFAAPSSPAFGMGSFRPHQQQQQQAAPFGQMAPAFGAFGGAPGGFGHPQAGAFPARPQAGGPFGMPQQPGTFGVQGMQGGFGGQQAAFGGQQAAFGGQQASFGGASDPFGSDSGFGSTFAQAPASGQSPTIGKLGGANSPAPGGAKDPFADLSTFH